LNGLNDNRLVTAAVGFKPDGVCQIGGSIGPDTAIVGMKLNRSIMLGTSRNPRALVGVKVDTAVTSAVLFEVNGVAGIFRSGDDELAACSCVVDIIRRGTGQGNPAGPG
jgi:hypothetical protein